ncbi:MAG: chorismate-binding protein [Actinobacteria bacterium]|nr:chorismate-binding protein [Actinomycetota bacterium]
MSRAVPDATASPRGARTGPGGHGHDGLGIDLSLLKSLTLPLASPLAPSAFLSLASSGGCYFESAGKIMASRGIAARIELPNGIAEPGISQSVVSSLARISSKDTLARGASLPIAIGVVPFDRDEPTELVVPEVLAVRDLDGLCWLTIVGRDPASHKDPGAQLLTGWQPPSIPELVAEAVTTSAGYKAGVRSILSGIKAGRYRKVVLAYETCVRSLTDCPIPPSGVLARLRMLQPQAILFKIDSMVGASPELLVSRSGSKVLSSPRAGTTRGSSGLDDALAASPKETEELDVVLEAVVQALLPYCRELSVPTCPQIVTLPGITHLGADVRGELCEKADGSLPSSLELVAALHPTPAVGGDPLSESLRAISSLEGRSRGRYAGAAGWVDARGDGEWAVAIRSAEIFGSSARLLAGAGIVAGSDPASELEEVRLKLSTMLQALGCRLPGSFEEPSEVA